MGVPKLLLPWCGKAIIEHVVDAWRASGVDEVIVVVRTDDAELANLIVQRGASLVMADPPPPDMKASVLAGLNWLAASETPRSADVWLTAPADLPTLSSEVIQRLLAAHDVSAPRVLVAGHHGRRGHPVLFPWRSAAEVAKLDSDEGLNRLLERSNAVVIECGEDALCADIDTPDDYERWQATS
jgi:molybdenum cofactor cytidylyltransferase